MLASRANPVQKRRPKRHLYSLLLLPNSWKPQLVEGSSTVGSRVAVSTRSTRLYGVLNTFSSRLCEANLRVSGTICRKLCTRLPAPGVPALSAYTANGCRQGARLCLGGGQALPRRPLFYPLMANLLPVPGRGLWLASTSRFPKPGRGYPGPGRGPGTATEPTILSANTANGQPAPQARNGAHHPVR
ncbi:hypothetical protein Bbelb_096280 [Branchiostoma belcheri]|nr:hypothetical protein Bbelb_096280 [Branchiostoma belcheri]